MSAHPPARRPDLDAVRRLYDAGESRNGIARALNVSTRQVDNAARELGLTFSSERTTAAVETYRATAAVERAELAARLRAVARTELAAVEDQELDVSDRRHHMAIAATAIDRDVRIGRLQLESLTSDQPDTAASVAAVLAEQFQSMILDTSGTD